MIGCTVLGLFLGLWIGNGNGTVLVVFLLSGYVCDLLLYAKKKDREYRAKAELPPVPGDTPIELLVFTLKAIGAVDGPLSDAERITISRILFEELPLSVEERNRAVLLIAAPLQPAQSFSHAVLKIYELYRTSPLILQQVLIGYCKVAACDGPLTDGEERLIRLAGDMFVVPDSWMTPMLEHLRAPDDSPAPEPSERKDPYAVLGCQRGDSEADIRREYRKLVMAYHPDRLTSKELPEDLVKYSAQRFQEIQQAFDEIRRDRHFERDDD